jgi:hypothetical protein
VFIYCNNVKQDAEYDEMLDIINNQLEIAGSAEVVLNN